MKVKLGIALIIILVVGSFWFGRQYFTRKQNFSDKNQPLNSNNSENLAGQEIPFGQAKIKKIQSEEKQSSPKNPSNKVNLEKIFNAQNKNSQKCLANFVKAKNNYPLEAGLVNKEEMDKIKTDNIFKFDELPELAYGFKIHKSPRDGYILTEICQGTKSISRPTLNKIVKIYAGASYNHFSQFDNPRCGGIVLRTIEKPGQYQFYIYWSRDKQNWYIVKKIDFTIK